MSQTKTVLKQIASGEEYQTLTTAIEEGNYEAICKSYLRIGELLKEAQKDIEAKIESLPRRNKDEERQKFQEAFDIRARTVLSQWYWVESELRERKVMEGTVIGVGGKGDPLVRSSEGRIVVVTGAELQEGEKVIFRITGESEKVDFGVVFELTPESFYDILTQESQRALRNALGSFNNRLRAFLQDTSHLHELGDLLHELEEIKKLTAKLQPEEKDRVMTQVMQYRSRLLNHACVNLMFDHISQEEVNEIEAFYQGDEQQKAEALSAPGLFRRQTHEAIKKELFSGDEIRGYSDVLSQLEEDIDSMHSAMEVMQFKTKIEDAYPGAKRYLENMDRLFGRLVEKSRQVAFTLTENTTSDINDIHSAIRDAFSGENLMSEFRRIFRNPSEFTSMRGALEELWTRFSESDGTVTEAAFKPYLRQKMEQAFGN
ncbi:hypothetical protein ACFLYL_00835 [Chloroflexota bacterium]